ncbi:MAG TPA: carboxypeptidase-like regulatory domain-containing protein [Bryobacteraceae bacterium]|nr:carboxypeptidase-like regulatory domain-containing protein [Bryobacteraceae bacterium]
MRFVLFVLASAVALAQNAPTATGTIHGVVQFAGGGQPIEGAQVRISPGGKEVRTDAQGHYSLDNLAARSYYIQAFSQRHPGAFQALIRVLGAGQDLAVDFHLPPMASISGRVLDQNDEPVPNVSVFLITRQYSAGALGYIRVSVQLTNDRGEYKLPSVNPDRGFFVLAKKMEQHVDAISDAPADPKLRKRIAVPTYYPGTDSLEGAEIVRLRPGENREGVDIRLLRSASYCADGVLEGPSGPAELHFWFEELRPSDGVTDVGGMYIFPTQGATGSDGRFRLCNLHPGEYRLTASDGQMTVGGTAQFSILDADVHNVRLNFLPRVAVPGEIVFDGKAPENPVERKVSVLLWPPVARTVWNGESTSTESTVPGEFTFPSVSTGEFPVDVRGLPGDLYVKDVLYSGQSVLHRTFTVGGAIGKATLRIVVATGGALIKGTVTDKDNNPVPDCYTAVAPVSAASEAEFSAAVLFPQCDQNGAWSTPRLAPGKYYVIPSRTAFDHSPETIDRLWGSRASAHEVDLTAGATEQLTQVLE